ncbi:MAG TPA: lytic transglycosylase domain-containing protein, partial [Nitrospirales bacterium]|nr:lytic transglycosylase domain-containing protein [Nitrospirales bacterium]
PHSLSSDVHYAKVRGLYELGLFNEAAMEMQEVYRRYGDQPQVFQSLVAMAATVKAYNLGIKLAIRHFGESIWKGELSRTSDAWWGAFPIGYQGLIQELAPSDVDPYLVAGLIREESLYNPRARSGVGAMGLMQLMPATARRMAHQVGMSSWEEDSEALFHPERNIRLGATYLGQLLDDFHGNLVYAIASYNAGPSAVKRWMGKYGQRSLDEFVELIGYRETRGYVKRVLGSYWIYRAIFSTGCERVSLDTYC